MPGTAAGFTKDEMDEMEAAPAEEAPASQPAKETESPPDTGAQGTETETPAPKQPAGELKKAPPPKGYVEVEALQEERRKSRELHDKVGKIEQFFAEVQRASQQRPQQPQQQIPEFDADPLGHLKGVVEQLRQENSRLASYNQQRQQYEQQQVQSNQVMAQYAAAVNSYAKQQTDFNDAYRWLETSVDTELQARGFADATERTNVMMGEELALVQRALLRGDNPAQILYNLAVHRGYKKADAQPAERKLDQVRKGVAAARSLSGSAPPENEMDLNSILKLDGAEFDKAFDKWKRQAGGR